MVWIDEVSSYDSAQGECFVELKANAPYFSSHGLRGTSLIEFIAQGFGYISAAHARSTPGSKKLTRAFLVGVTNFEATDLQSLIPGTHLLIRITNIRPMGPISLLDGQVMTTDGALVGKASLKVYGE